MLQHIDKTKNTVAMTTKRGQFFSLFLFKLFTNRCFNQIKFVLPSAKIHLKLNTTTIMQINVVSSVSLPADEYLEITLSNVTLISSIATQGSNTTNTWVETYNLTYSMDGLEWSSYDIQFQTKVGSLSLFGMLLAVLKNWYHYDV